MATTVAQPRWLKHDEFATVRVHGDWLPATRYGTDDQIVLNGVPIWRNTITEYVGYESPQGETRRVIFAYPTKPTANLDQSVISQFTPAPRGGDK